jgi:hypothetical protein
LLGNILSPDDRCPGGVGSTGRGFFVYPFEPFEGDFFARGRSALGFGAGAPRFSSSSNRFASFTFFHRLRIVGCMDARTPDGPRAGLLGRVRGLGFGRTIGTHLEQPIANVRGGVVVVG